VATRKGKGKHVPPSRLRYEPKNPTVSLRISQEMRNELQYLKATVGMSVAEVLRVGLDKIQPEMEKFFDLGEEDARGTYEVTYCCSECGEPHLSISSNAEKEAAAQYMYENGWHDRRCRADYSPS
jgi:predicted DNA-binding protein